MKMIIQDINELSDSREILESKPHPFTTIFIYMILAMFLGTLIWSWFSEKEIVVKANGVVKPNEDVYKIANPISTKVISINFKNGQEVKKDDILYSLDHKELDLQKDSLEKSINDKLQEYENLKKLKKSVEDGKNYFNKENEKEQEYYNKYVSYEKGYVSTETQSKSIISEKEDLNNKISQLRTLQKSIEENRNKFSNENVFYSQFIDYQLNVEQYESKIKQNENIYNSLKNNSNIAQDQINEASGNVENAKKELEKYKNQYSLNIKTSIEENEVKMKELEGNLSDTSKSNDLNKEKNKSNMIAQIDDTIKLNEEKLQEFNDNLKTVNINIDKCTVKSPCDGIVDMLSDLKVGDLLQIGTVISNILPNDNKYKVELYILNKDIANVKAGQEIKYEISSLPYKEYGYVKGKINKISNDSKLNEQTGLSFYTAEATIDKEVLYSHKSEKAEIKNGMICEGKIATRTEKMLCYILEKFDLRD